MKVTFKYFTNNGNERTGDRETVEDAILAYRKARKMQAGANFGQYSIDNGKNWVRI